MHCPMKANHSQWTCSQCCPWKPLKTDLLWIRMCYLQEDKMSTQGYRIVMQHALWVSRELLVLAVYSCAACGTRCSPGMYCMLSLKQNSVQLNANYVRECVSMSLSVMHAWCKDRWALLSSCSGCEGIGADTPSTSLHEDIHVNCACLGISHIHTNTGCNLALNRCYSYTQHTASIGSHIWMEPVNVRKHGFL